MDSIQKIIKRDGRLADFDVDKIADAIFKAAQVLGGRDREMSVYLAKQVELYLLEVCHNQVPTVEQIQDAVEKILIENGHARTAKEYILYRAERTRVRNMNSSVKMPILTAIPPWERCSNTVRRVRKSSTRAMSSIRNFPKHMRRAISIFTIWTSTR